MKKKIGSAVFCTGFILMIIGALAIDGAATFAFASAFVGLGLMMLTHKYIED